MWIAGTGLSWRQHSRCCIIRAGASDLPVRLDPREACAFADAVHKMEEHALHDFPIQGPRTTHWLLLDGDWRSPATPLVETSNGALIIGSLSYLLEARR